MPINQFAFAKKTMLLNGDRNMEKRIGNGATVFKKRHQFIVSNHSNIYQRII